MSQINEMSVLRISKQIVEAESALNEALAKQSKLFVSLVSVRDETKVGAFTGQDALMRLARSHQSLLAAGNDMARVHSRLLELARETSGTDMDCPDNWRQKGEKIEKIVA